MANRFSKPVNNKVLSQFVPQDMRLLASLVAQKQQRYDLVSEKAAAVEDAMSKLSGVGEADQAILQEAGNQMNQISQDFHNKDLSDSRIGRDFMSKSKQVLNNPLVMATQKTAAAAAKHAEDQQAMMKAGTYAEENDPFLQQIRQYNESGGAINGAIGYNGIIQKADERAEMEKMFNNMPKSGYKTFAQIGETIKQVGYEGISKERMFGDPKNPNDHGMVGIQFNAHMSSPAGQQQLRRYQLLKSRGNIPEDMTPEEYILGHLSAAAAEYVGGITTGGQGGSDGLGGSGDGFGGNQRASAKFTTPLARELADAGFDFDDETGEFEGSGTATFKEFMNNPSWSSFIDVFTDDTMTEEELAIAKPVQIIADLEGVTPKEAYAMMEQRSQVSPTYKPYTTTAKRNLAQAEFQQKGAGHYSSMMVYDQDGTPLNTGRAVFEELGLLNDEGEWQKDVADTLGVNVLGQHNPNSGLVANGLHVAIGGKTFIFEETISNRNQRKAKTVGDIKNQGIGLGEDGNYWIWDGEKMGRYNEETKQVVYND